MDLIYADALEISRALQNRQISSEELMHSTLARIGEVNPKVNAIVSMRDETTLLDEARAADNSPRRGWLHGIPLAVKDLADVAGLPTSRGSPLYAGQVAATDDLLASRLRSAGAIFIGKTNTPEFGLGSHTVNPVHGATCNPYDTSRSAGGSSGGAAAALAAGMLCVADGSDMMGSLRNPAAWNNVYGMRPSWGRVPDPSNAVPVFNQFSTHGPMARAPSDLAALLDTLSGKVPGVPGQIASDATLPMIDALEKTPRVGWLGDWGGAYAMEDGILACCEAALDDMRGLGWHVDSLPPPFPAEALWDSWVCLRAYVKAMGMKPDFDAPERRALFGEAVIWEIGQGLAQSPEALWRANRIRSDWYSAAEALFETFDILALPSAQVWPFDVSMDFPRSIAGRDMDTYHRWMEIVIAASLIGLPVVNVPCGFGPAGMPMGLQLIGAPGSDTLLLQCAQKWHTATRWPQERPPVFD